MAHGQLIFFFFLDKPLFQRHCNGERLVSLTNSAGTVGHSYANKRELQPIPYTHYVKIKMHHRPKFKITLLKENIGGNLCDLELDTDFLEMTTKKHNSYREKN